MRRLGTFKVSLAMINDVIDGKISGINLFKDMFVLDVKVGIVENYSVYKCYHPDFDLIKEGEKIPEYQGIFDSEHIYPRWEKII